jgi:nitrous oxidase accessory protein NosD
LTFANGAFNVLASGVWVSSLIFDGLRFTGCRVAIQMLTVEGGTYTDVTVRNLEVSNAIVALSFNGVAKDLSIRDCTIENADTGIRIAGTDVRSTGVEVSGNHVIGLADGQVAKAPQTGIFLNRADARVHDNVVTGFSRFVVRVGVGIEVGNDVDDSYRTSVFANSVNDSSIGISLTGRATAEGRVFSNTVHRAILFGINLRFGANGWRVGVNEFLENALDVNLAGRELFDPFGTNGNMVYLLPGHTYADGGDGNTIIVR